jgi:type VII secretion-associated serine protease mycosin
VRRALAVAAVAILIGAAAPAHAAPGPQGAPEYWFDSWHITQLWDSGVRGQGITIAEVDTGVNARLPELAASVLPGKDFGRGGDGRTDREVNEFGHGTAMASIMVAHPGVLGITGLAPDAKLLPISVPLTGTTDAAPYDHLAEAIRWAVDHGGKVISMSLGGARSPSTDSVPCPAAEQSAVYYALSKGAVLLAAAGNNGRSTNAVEEPGVCLGVVSVGAVDETGTLADFSSRHPYLTLAAPGVSIASLSRIRGSAYSGDGTSQATAIASAVVALVWSKYPTLTGRQIVTRVLATLDRHTNHRDPGYGFGIIDAYRAVTRAVPATAANPVYAAAAPFLARNRAFTKAVGAVDPPPAATEPKPVGKFSIGNAPRLFVPRVLGGIAVAAAGLLILIALAVAAGVRRARRRPSAIAVAEQVLVPRDSMHAPRDDAGLAWHDITGPSAESEPDPSTR